jgi:hypothetical protein
MPPPSTYSSRWTAWDELWHTNQHRGVSPDGSAIRTAPPLGAPRQPLASLDRNCSTSINSTLFLYSAPCPVL